MARLAVLAACLAVAPCAALLVRAPESSAAKKLSLKQKKLRCLKVAAHKRTARVRRRARRRCAKRYGTRRLTPRPPAPTPARPPAAKPGEVPATVLPRYVSVTAREFYLTLSRPLVGAGQVTIELRNYGEDPHDLAVEAVGAGWPALGPGGVQAKKVTLAPGSYKLFCSIEGHEQLGMKATLKVQG